MRLLLVLQGGVETGYLARAELVLDFAVLNGLVEEVVQVRAVLFAFQALHDFWPGLQRRCACF